MSAEIFAVGPHVALAGTLNGQRAELDVLSPTRQGAMRMTLAEGSVWMEMISPTCPASASEVLRLAARLAQKAWLAPQLLLSGALAQAAATLVEDGFQQLKNGVWRREPAPFLRASGKAMDFEDVYHDPWSVPWNFVAAEVEVYADLRYSPSCRLLDLGCGYGKNSRVLDRWGHEVVALDISPTAVRYCQSYLPTVAGLVGSATALPFADRSFDVVVDVGCLHCLPANGRQAGVAEIARVLRPGGTLYSRVFKPREHEWIAAQPFEATEFGLAADEVTALLGPYFDITWSLRHEHMHYARCVRPEAS